MVEKNRSVEYSVDTALTESTPPLTKSQAIAEAHRCLNCFDAPCTQVCPTHIDVPKFIGKIATGNLRGSAITILDSNLLGATCARVCPVQELCEGACVLGADHQPIQIGRLQRYAMDSFDGRVTVQPKKHIGRVAVVGAGPAGLSCAGELARKGIDVTLYEKNALPGGLSTFGIVSLREPVKIAIEEAKIIEDLGVEIRLNSQADWQLLAEEYDAVFLAIGNGIPKQLEIPDERFVIEGLDFIEKSKLFPLDIQVGSKVVVIGGGNTAVDCAMIAAKLGAETVTVVYRRDEQSLSAYEHELATVRKLGVRFEFNCKPVRFLVSDEKISGLECARDQESLMIEADQVIRAIGQDRRPVSLQTLNGFIVVDSNLRTSHSKVFAGGDCIRAKGAASTVMAVQDGKLAAQSIHMMLETHRG